MNDCVIQGKGKCCKHPLSPSSVAMAEQQGSYDNNISYVEREMEGEGERGRWREREREGEGILGEGTSYTNKRETRKFFSSMK